MLCFEKRVDYLKCVRYNKEKAKEGECLKDFTFWNIYEEAPEGSGRSEKIWLINPDNNQIGLFKFKKDKHTTDYISERISYQIAELLGIPCARFDIGSYEGRDGCMSYNIVEKSEITFIEGIAFINFIYPGYDPDKFIDTESGDRYSLEMIERALTGYGVFDQIIGMLVFDYLIGNTDRHQNNWALMNEADSWILAPLYDNSSSLCAYVSGENIDRYLGNDKLLWKSLVDTKSKSCIRLRMTDEKRPTHLEVMRYCHENYFVTSKKYVERICERMTKDKIRGILGAYSADELKDNKKRLIERFLEEKIVMLIDLFSGKEGEPHVGKRRT